MKRTVKISKRILAVLAVVLLGTGAAVPTMAGANAAVVMAVRTWKTLPKKDTEASVVVQGEKTLFGGSLEDGMFTFELLDSNGVVKQTVNSKDGSFAFEPLMFSRSGVYQYKVREKQTDNTSNTQEIPVKVTVADTERGLEASYRFTQEAKTLDAEKPRISTEFSNRRLFVARLGDGTVNDSGAAYLIDYRNIYAEYIRNYIRTFNLYANPAVTYAFTLGITIHKAKMVQNGEGVWEPDPSTETTEMIAMPNGIASVKLKAGECAWADMKDLCDIGADDESYMGPLLASSDHVQTASLWRRGFHESGDAGYQDLRDFEWDRIAALAMLNPTITQVTGDYAVESMGAESSDSAINVSMDDVPEMPDLGGYQLTDEVKHEIREYYEDASPEGYARAEKFMALMKMDPDYYSPEDFLKKLKESFDIPDSDSGKIFNESSDYAKNFEAAMNGKADAANHLNDAYFTWEMSEQLNGEEPLCDKMMKTLNGTYSWTGKWDQKDSVTGHLAVFWNQGSIGEVKNNSTVGISKTDSDGKPVEGAKLQLEQDGKKISGWTSGKETKTFYLGDGTYTLTETEAPAGYRKAAPVTFTVKEGKVTGENSETAKLQGSQITMVDLRLEASTSPTPTPTPTVKPSPSATPTPTVKPRQTPAAKQLQAKKLNSSKNASSAKTGDRTNLVLPIIALAGAVAVIIIVVSYRKRKK